MFTSHNTSYYDQDHNHSLTIWGSNIPDGRIAVSGAKNAATRLLAAALLTDEIVCLTNFPTELLDARHKASFIEDIGGVVRFDPVNQNVSINASGLVSRPASSFKVPVRTTYLLAAGLLKRFGVARIPYPGGCKIGNRRYDLHIMLWKKMGCNVQEKPEYIEIRAHKLTPFDVSFPISTIGGTENALICGAMIDGNSTVRNAYISPEVANLIDYLNFMGAEIQVSGNSFINIRGTSSLRGTTFKVIPDRIEALTWIIFGAISKGKILIENVPFEQMEIPLIHLREAGVDVFHNSSNVYISPECFKQESIQPFEVACGTHPGVISDMQPFYVLLALKAAGISRIYDYRYPDRTNYLQELIKFCPEGSISWESGKITVHGPVNFMGANVKSTDLRGSMALLLAALLADGRSVVHDIGMALRGYNNLMDKLSQLGVILSEPKIERNVQESLL